MSLYNPYADWPVSCDWECHTSRPGLGAIDYAIRNGTPLPALFDGVLSNIPNNGTGGNTAILTGADGRKVEWMHLSQLYPEGNYKLGQIIGLSGGIAGAPGSGNSTGPHVHMFGINSLGNRVPYQELLVETPTNRKSKKMEYGFIRSEDGSIAVVYASDGTKRPISNLAEWLGYAANGAAYANVTSAQYDAVPNRK